MRDPFDNLNLDHTDTPSFPDEPEELGNVSNSTSIPAFNFNSSFRSEPEQPKVVNDEEKSTSIPAFNFNKPVDEETPKKSNSAFDFRKIIHISVDKLLICDTVLRHILNKTIKVFLKFFFVIFTQLCKFF